MIDERYEVVRLLGEGSQAQVYEVRERESDTVYAMKYSEEDLDLKKEVHVL